MVIRPVKLSSELRGIKIVGHRNFVEAKAAEDSRTPRPRGIGIALQMSRSVVECGCPLPLSTRMTESFNHTFGTQLFPSSGTCFRLRPMATETTRARRADHVI